MWEGDVWVAQKAARAGVDVVQTGFFSTTGVEFKGAANPVTEVDIASEKAITTVIAGHFPQDSILAEEGGGADWRSGRVWIVDPLDGTVNFIHGIPQVSVTVALWNDGEPVVGVTIDVATNEEWVAVKGGGATLNGQPIHVSTTSQTEKALILSGFPYDQADHSTSYLDLTRELLAGTMVVRVMGSAALDLAWVAAGRADGYCEHGGPEGIKPWDMAAGALMVTEAGGRFTDHLGEPHRLDSPVFVASNGIIHDDLLDIARRTLPEHLR